MNVLIDFLKRSVYSKNERRDGRVVEGNGLLNRRTCLPRTEGSNPSLSANLQRSNFLSTLF